MKLINLFGSRVGKGEMVTGETINTISGIFSAVMFGLVHSNQSLVKSVAAGVYAYCYSNHLYEKNGLFGSFGLHFANNFFVSSLFYLTKPAQ